MRLPWDIDDQMKFEFIEPSKDTFLFSDKFLECFMLLFSFDVAAADEGWIDKKYTSTLPQSFYSEEDDKRHANLSLKSTKRL